MPVLNRAELSRTGVVFVALIAIVPMGMGVTGIVARDLGSAGSKVE
ncbi:hypothetical protein JQ554_29300 [Bradyrhizobium diazoefficiens]|nr:hypothetical protein [Bradyrhizobium diazoefficiens]UCF50864.1 MAG: hypothetical protein JSV48_14780 [Bradyrhizobium sp.]MBR0968193.1 hypothetical protein [Bradyrhizobium diazoefficiens]MBR0981590.1 hypothetical protein [Bradyrhizobium diazoefficiens]MBR1011043.1 hypothetical protein [Bradyrhizobium diazoefficiens]MBR1017543.1 hypothetical protein [Bradyrhizobium diazoefficiens]